MPLLLHILKEFWVEINLRKLRHFWLDVKLHLKAIGLDICLCANRNRVLLHLGSNQSDHSKLNKTLLSYVTMFLEAHRNAGNIKSERSGRVHVKPPGQLEGSFLFFQGETSIFRICELENFPVQILTDPIAALERISDHQMVPI